MGEAKKRGTLQQRMEQARERLAAERAEKERERLEAVEQDRAWLASLPDEARRRELDRRRVRKLRSQHTTAMLAAVLAMGR